MSRSSQERSDVLEALLRCVSRYPQGVTSTAMREGMSEKMHDLCDEAIATAIAQGWCEPSPIFLDRLRWSRSDGAFAQAAAWVRLRTRAVPLLARIHRHSGLPVTLHVLVGPAHAVIARFPGDPPGAIIEETSRYSNPRSLTNGMTSKVFLACLPEQIDRAGLVDQGERAMIRRLGFGYAPAARAGWGGVLSAPVRALDGAPLAALCTFGAAQSLAPERLDAIGPVMREAAEQLAAQSEADAHLLRVAADALIPPL